MSPLFQRRGGRRGRRQRMGNFAVGLVAIAVVLLGTYFGFKKDVPIVHGYQVDGVFKSGNSIRTGSPVRIAGVDVGKVTGIEGGPGDSTIVNMELKDSARPIHQDATMRIRARVFLEGGFYVQLEPGTPRSGELESGGTIPLSQTAVPVQWDQVLSTFDEPTRDSLRNIVSSLDTALDGGGAEGLNRTTRQLPPFFRDASLVAEATQGALPHDLSDMVASTSRVTAALADREEDLGGLVTALNRTTRALASEDEALSEGIREFNQVLQVAPPALDALDASLPAIERFGDAVRPALRIAPPILANGTELLNEVNGLAGPRELPRLLRDLSPAVRGLPTLERRLRALLPRVKRVTDCVRDRALPVLNAQVDDGALSTNRPVWQDLAHGFVGLASSTQSFDANGPSVRYFAPGGPSTISLGNVPGVGELFGNQNEQFQGARPVWLGNGVVPPHRPDQECTEQAPPDLSARTGPVQQVAASVPRPRERERLSLRELHDLIRDLPENLEVGER